MLSTASDSIVILRGGLTVSLPALRVLWDLENRGLTIRLDADGGLLVGPRDRLTPADRELIHRHRDQLIALVSYEPETVQ